MKAKIVIAVLVIFFMIKPKRWAYAVDNATVDVIMSIQSVDVTGIAVFDAVSAPVGGSKVLRAGNGIGRAVFTNTGNGNEDFLVGIASTSGSWTPFFNATAVPANQYRLRAIWAAYQATFSSQPLLTADFDNNDILTSSNFFSSPTVFFSDTAPSTRVGTPEFNGGRDIPVAGIGDNQRHLFIRFDAGAAGTVGTATAHVNVSALATP